MRVEKGGQVRVLDPPGRGGGNRGLGVEGDTEAGGLQHRQIVGAVADGKRLAARYSSLRRQGEQGPAFRFPGHDRRPHGAGDLSAGQVEMIGNHPVEAEFAGHPIGEDREAAGDERAQRAVPPHRCHQRPRAGADADPGRCGSEGLRIHPGEKADARRQGVDEIELAIHRPSRDLGDLPAQTEKLAEFVEHFVLDDRRFHVGDEEPLAPISRGLKYSIDRSAGKSGADVALDIRRLAALHENIAGNAGGEPDRLLGAGQAGHDRIGEIGQADTDTGVGNQGEDEAHGPSYAGNRTRGKRDAPPVVIIAGPTASGKSGLALALAGTLAGTIINADSMQIYRDLRILTARPDAAAEAQAPHRLYGYRDAAEPGSAASWREEALAEIADAIAAGRLPIVVGGSGLYLRALVAGLAPVPEIPAAIRREARALHRALGGAGFRQRLAVLDPQAAGRLPPGDTQRLLRAYEVVRATGAPIGLWRRRPHEQAQYRFATILLMPPRAALYAACDARFAAMMDAGGLAEAAALATRRLDPDLPAMKALGLAELFAYLRGKMPLAEAVAAAQQATRRYAKRQTTWFRHQGRADLILSEPFNGQFSERLLRCSRQFIDAFLLTAPP